MHDPLVVAFVIKRPWPDGYKAASQRCRYWPAMITVWHREPGGHDSGTICKWGGHWRWHIHHWKIQIQPLQHLRRWALTRCAWCGGKNRKGDPVNFGSSWDGVRTRWWRGEADLRHHDCDMVWRASRKCLCESPALPPSDYGTCFRCSKFRAWNADVSDADRLLASLPKGGRIPAEMRSRLDAIWDARLEARGIDPATTIRPWRDER